MKDHCSIEELSAYIDGTSSKPGRVADHLTHCPECTRRCREFSALSARLHALPEPELHPAFVTRVMAHASETHPEPKARWAWAWPRTLLAGGLATVLTLGIFLAVSGREGRPDTAMRVAETEPYYAPEGTGTFGDEVSTEDLVAGLADTEWFVTLAAAWEDDDDLDAVIQSLNSDETVTFEKLLREYAEENPTI